MTTIAQLVDQVLDLYLEPNGPGQVNRLNANINNSIETLTLLWHPAPPLVPGSYLQIDSELLLVLEANDREVTVLRGQRGTTAAGHTTTSPLIVGPSYPRQRLLLELQSEIRSWPPSVYGVTTVELAWPASTYDLDLTGATGRTVHRVLRASLAPTGEGPWYDLGASVRVFPADTVDFASGWRLHSLDARGAATVSVTYAHDFDLSTLDETDDAETDLGLATSMLDIARLGVAWRVLTAQEIQRARLDQAGQTRRAEEVPPQHQLTAAEALMQARDLRLGQEAERLLSQWGVT